MPSLRYVVLHHTKIDVPHFDLMLEVTPGSELLTWRVGHWPPDENDEFTPLPAHRRDYLEYEGPISGDRGEVRRVACGIHQVLENGPTQLVIRLQGILRIQLRRA